MVYIAILLYRMVGFDKKKDHPGEGLAFNFNEPIYQVLPPGEIRTQPSKAIPRSAGDPQVLGKIYPPVNSIKSHSEYF